MNRLKYVVSVIILGILVFQCGGDKSTSPESDAVLIGQQGGVVTEGGIYLSIPEGAFQSNTSISIDVVNPQAANESAGLTDVYEIYGLPQSISEPLQIRMKYNKDPEGEIYLAVGLMTPHYLEDDSSLNYYYLPAEVENNYLTARLTNQIHDGLTKKTPQFKAFPIDAATRYVQIFGIDNIRGIKEDYFWFFYPDMLQKTHVQDLADLFADMRVHIQDMMGFEYLNDRFNSNHGYRNWDWPIMVFLTNTKSKVSLRISKKFQGDPYFNVDASLLGSQGSNDSFKKAGQALLDLALKTYTLDNWRNTWFRKAFVEWMETYFSAQTRTVPPEHFEGHEMAPFYGMLAGSQENKKHAYGMAAVVQYLMDSDAYGWDGFLSTFDQISLGADATGTLLQDMQADVEQWWPDFFRFYISGQLYDMDVRVFGRQDHLSGAWAIHDSDDTDKTFQSTDKTVGAYPDLSAKLFAVQADVNALEPGNFLSLTASGNTDQKDIAVLVFASQDNGWEPLNDRWDTGPSFVISDFYERVKDGYNQFLIAVVNSNRIGSFLGSTDIDLTIQVGKAEPPPDYNECSIMVETKSLYAYSSPQSSYERTVDDALCQTYTGYQGRFSGRTFTGSFNDNQHNILRAGSIVLTLSADHQSIETIRWTEQTTHANGTVESITFQGFDIPFKWQYTSTNDHYEIAGEETCSHISTLSHVQNSPDGLNYSLRSYECTRDSRIWVSLDKE